MGVCVGVSRAPPVAYAGDVIHFCAIKEEAKAGEKCKPGFTACMTPREAVILGSELIRASVFGEIVLDTLFNGVKKGCRPNERK